MRPGGDPVVDRGPGRVGGLPEVGAPHAGAVIARERGEECGAQALTTLAVQSVGDVEREVGPVDRGQRALGRARCRGEPRRGESQVERGGELRGGLAARAGEHH